VAIIPSFFAAHNPGSYSFFLAGLCLEWSKDEYQASNIPYTNRGERADEFLQVLTKIWNDDVVEFKGKYYIHSSNYNTHINTIHYT